MLIAYSFPADEFVSLYEAVSPLLKTHNVIPHKDFGFDKSNIPFSRDEQYPHISVVYNIRNLSENERNAVKEQFKNKPTFIPQGWRVFPGGQTDFGYLVLEFNKPAKMQNDQEFLVKEFGATKMVDRPHCSIIRFPKKQISVVEDLLPKIDKATQQTLKSSYVPDHVQFWDKEGDSYEIVAFTEKNIMNKSKIDEANKKKKKRFLAAFYGKGDGKSGATVPPFRAPSANPSPKLGPSLPGPTGINSPLYGTLPAGPTAPMVTSDSSFEDALNQFKTALAESQHICLVCDNSGKVGTANCPICSVEWRTERVRTAEESAHNMKQHGNNSYAIVSPNSSDAALFAGLDKGWDLESKNQNSNLIENNLLFAKDITPEQFRGIFQKLVPNFVVNDKPTQSKFDILVDKTRGTAHVLKSVFDGRGWETAQTVPERAKKLTHIGVFDSPRAARKYLSYLGVENV